MKKQKSIFFVLLICLSAICCTDIIETAPAEEDTNHIIFISSFESNEHASMGRWISPGPPFVKFSDDVPAPGGKFSVLLKAVDQGASIKNTFAVPKGNYNYRFSLWGKNPKDEGEADLYFLSEGKKILKGKFLINSEAWKYYSFKDNLSAAEGDSMALVINGAYINNNEIGVTWVDLCLVEIID